MPLSSSDSLMLALTATVYILFGLSTCSTKECGQHITQKMKDRSGTLRNIDNMLCQVYCKDDLIFASCRKSKKMKKTGGSSVPPQNHPHVSYVNVKLMFVEVCKCVTVCWSQLGSQVLH